MSKRLTLVLGGVRAGKSRYAQQLAEDGRRVLFAATAEAGDEEMAARIQAHRAERPTDWDTLGRTAGSGDGSGAALARLRHRAARLSDLVGQQPANSRMATTKHVQPDIQFTGRPTARAIPEQGDAAWIVVSNEVGLGVVPATKLGRVYANELGRVNQRFAAAADDVIVMFAGLPVNLKALGLKSR